MKKQTAKTLAKIARDAGRMPLPWVRQLRSAVADAQREVVIQLDAWIHSEHLVWRDGKWIKVRGLDGLDLFTARHYRSVLRAINKAQVAIDRLDPVTAITLKSGHKIATGKARAHFSHAYRVLSQDLDGATPLIPREVWRFMDGGRPQKWEHYETSAARYSGNVGKHLRRHFRIAVIKRETFAQMAKRIGSYFRADSLGHGLFKSPHYWAERLVRTEMMHAYGAANAIIAKNAHKTLGTLSRWDATADLRLCATCASLHGTIVTPGEPFPGGYYQEPAHPNCRCRVMVWRKEWSDDITDSPQLQAKEKMIAERDRYFKQKAA